MPTIERVEATDDQRITFRVLGGVEARRDGRLLPLGGARQRALLALLLLEAGRPVSADRLIDELWAGEPPDGAEVTLRSYVSRLRAALGEVAVRKESTGYSLVATQDAMDAGRFERLVREGEQARSAGNLARTRDRLVAALDQWAGSPFGELATGGALRMEAERLEELRVRALELRIEADLELGLAEPLVNELSTLVLEHPFRERFWSQLMLALYRAGRQADALDAYQRARAVLEEQLGLEPGEEIERLQVAILRHEVPPARPAQAQHRLPESLTSFIGREAELTAVVDLVSESRLVTLTGVGGVGKTRLALEAARRHQDDVPGGAIFVDLSSLADAALLPGHVAAALELREQPGVSTEDLLLTVLRERAPLLLLDNCEHIREGVAVLARSLLGASREVRILATSRELLGVPGEVEFAVPPLRLPSSGDPDSVRSSDAVTLLLDRAATARPGLQPSDEALATAARIVQDLDGLPLAIELAAARARVLSLPDIAERLSDRFRFLVSWRRLTSARHRTLREAMDWSYELLGHEEQRLLCRLSVFSGGFTLAAVSGAKLVDGEDDALRHVERLVDASLVSVVESATGTRYRLLETVRQYAADRLPELDEPQDRRRAHARYFADVAAAAPVRGPGQAASFDLIDADLDNFRAALDHAADADDVDLELRLCAALWRFWQVRGHLVEGRGRIEAALARPDAPGSTAYEHALFGAGILAWAVGDYDRGEAVARELLDRASRSGSKLDEHNAHKILGMVALRRRDFAASERHSMRTLEVARELGVAEDVLVAELNHAVLVMDWGRVGEAVPRLEAVLEAYQAIGNPEGIGLARLNLGEAAALIGQDDQARVHFEDARTAFAAIGFRAHVGHALRGLAAVEARLGNATEAARLLGRADAVMADVGASEDDFAPPLVAAAESTARAALGDAAYREAFESGRALERAGRRR